MITYEQIQKKTGTHSIVKLDGKTVGQIKPVPGGYAYFPKGSKRHGNILPTLREVKNTL